MIKRMVLFTEPQWIWLEQEAKRLGISIPELLRRIVDNARKNQGGK